MNSTAFTPESVTLASLAAEGASRPSDSLRTYWDRIVTAVVETLQLAPPTVEEIQNASSGSVPLMRRIESFVQQRNCSATLLDPEREAIKRALWGEVTFPRGDKEGERLVDRIQEELRKVRK